MIEDSDKATSITADKSTPDEADVFQNIIIKFTRDNLPPETWINGEIEITLPELYITKSGKIESQDNDDRIYLTKEDIMKRLANASEYHIYLLASIYRSKCQSSIDEDIIKAYEDAFEKIIGEGGMDTIIRGDEMVLRLVLGEDVHYW